MTAHNISDLRSAAPAEIDGVLAELTTEHNRYRRYVEAGTDSIRREQARNRTRGVDDSRRVEELQQQLDGYQQKLTELEAAMAPLEDEYVRRGRWHRYYLVTNGNGHVHRSRNCSKCYPTTQYAWLPELSDCDESAMIEEFGESACTHCFPDAPSNPAFHTPGRRAQADIDRRAQERADRDRIKQEKGIRNPDGSTLRSAAYGVIRTAITAENVYADSSAYARQLRRRSAGADPEDAANLNSIAEEHEVDATLLLEALAAKYGRTVEEQKQALAAKVERKYKKDYSF